MRVRAWFIALLLVVTRLSAQPTIEFVGVLVAGSETKVSLVEKPSGASRWVKVGQEFGGYVLAAYEPANDVAVLSKDGQKFRLQLKSSSKVKSGAAAEPSPEIKRAILNNLRQLAAAADQYYLENGKTQATLDDLVGETKYVKKLNVIDGENYGQIVFAMAKPLTVTTAGGFTMSYNP